MAVTKMKSRREPDTAGWDRLEDVAAANAADEARIQNIVRDIWCEILERDTIGLHDDFFQLGGDSIRAWLMMTRVEERLGIAIEMGTVFENSTLEKLSQVFVALSRNRTAVSDA